MKIDADLMQPPHGTLEPFAAGPKTSRGSVSAVSDFFDDIAEHGHRKYGGRPTVKSSIRCEWKDVAAEVRQHPKIILPPVDLRLMEVVISTRLTPDTVIARKGGGEFQVVSCEPGMVWTCPLGIHEDEVNIKAPIELLHMYLPSGRFDQLAEVCGGPPVKASAIGYVAGVRDDLIRQIGISFMAEMKSQTSAGRVFIDALALSLTARLAQAYSNNGVARVERVKDGHGLEDARVNRVIDYMHAHLDTEISIDDLAAVACLSPFHFARLFQN